MLYHKGPFKYRFEKIQNFISFTYMYLYYREKKREKERDELWKKLTELEIERRNIIERNALTAPISNNPVPATNTPTTRTRP